MYEKEALVFLITDQSVIKVHNRDPVNAMGVPKAKSIIAAHKIMASLRVGVPTGNGSITK